MTGYLFLAVFLYDSSLLRPNILLNYTDLRYPSMMHWIVSPWNDLRKVLIPDLRRSLLGNKVFKEAIKLEMNSLQQALVKHNWYPYKSGKFEHRDGQTSRKTTGTHRTGMMCPQAKEHVRHHKPGTPSPKASEERRPRWHLGQLSRLRNRETTHFCCLTHPALGPPLQHPSEMNRASISTLIKTAFQVSREIISMILAGREVHMKLPWQFFEMSGSSCSPTHLWAWPVFSSEGT